MLTLTPASVFMFLSDYGIHVCIAEFVFSNLLKILSTITYHTFLVRKSKPCPTISPMVSTVTLHKGSLEYNLLKCQSDYFSGLVDRHPIPGLV